MSEIIYQVKSGDNNEVKIADALYEILKNEENTSMVNSVIYLPHTTRSRCGRDLHFRPLYSKLRGLP
ncbi:hypothetical protein ACCY16_11380 [Candidatus Pantoea formicae]|uniref:hypothetical protein n=1 Tax=Candidatus Pantoea formicae TaxID=2608355 RepID=UPI003EDB0CD8